MFLQTQAHMRANIVQDNVGTALKEKDPPGGNMEVVEASAFDPIFWCVNVASFRGLD
jgi:hypothetical protein